MTKVFTGSDEHKYQRIANGIEKLIQDEIIKIGERLPSVRMLSDEYGISMGTAFQAYYHLEGKGLIESRPKSGYYVRFNNKRYPAVPSVSLPEPMIHELKMEDIIAHIYKDISSDDLINFSLASPAPELLPAARLNKSIQFAIHNGKHNCLLYENVQGNSELRKQIAKLCFNWGGKVTADDIVITSGCMEALVICLKCVTQPGDAIAIESPTYFGILQLIQSLGLKAIELPTDPVTGVQLDQLEKAIKKFKIKACLFIPNFNNPLGSCMTEDRKQQLVELITRYQIPLIEDDIYGELYFGKKRPGTCKLYDHEGWVMQCSSFSKSLVPGYRIGWCLPGKFIESVKKMRMLHSITGVTVTQVAIGHFLGIGRYEYHLKNLRSALHTQALKYIQGIIDYFPDDIKISRPQGGFVLWIELNKTINGFELYQQAIKYSISITPGQVFSATGNHANFIRIAFGNKYDSTTEYGLKVLGKLIKNVRKKNI